MNYPDRFELGTLVTYNGGSIGVIIGTWMFDSASNFVDIVGDDPAQAQPGTMGYLVLSSSTNQLMSPERVWYGDAQRQMLKSLSRPPAARLR